MDFQERIITILASIGITEATLEMPPNPAMGDFALPTFTLAKERHQAPAVIATNIANELTARNTEFLEKILPTGPYVNFFIKPSARATSVITSIHDGKFWQHQNGNQRILIEYPSPNTNKPLHLGHVRNMVLGSTLARLYKFAGNTVFQINLNNDRGIAICKSMLAYQKWGKNKEPDKKSDHFVGDYYVMYSTAAKEQPRLEEEAQAMLRSWENNDPTTRALWERMNKWALEGFRTTYNRFHITFDKEYYESEIYKAGKDLVLAHKDQLVTDDTGAVYAPLEPFHLPNKYLLRQDGTTLYMTQDIAFTMQKMREYHPDLHIWVVGSEQLLHFQQLFTILELLGLSTRERFLHLSYGMVDLPSGRMKSREGTVIDADDLLDELEALAKEEIQHRHPDWDEHHLTTTTTAVAMSALRFFMIKYDPAKDFTFDPNGSLSFEGDTGPYLQYTHARLCSISKKTTYPTTADTNLLTAPEEQELLRQLSLAPPALRKAISERKPSVLATILIDIARAANTFYHACPVITAPPTIRDARLHLLDVTRIVLDEGLDLLGIEALNEM